MEMHIRSWIPQNLWNMSFAQQGWCFSPLPGTEYSQNEPWKLIKHLPGGVWKREPTYRKWNPSAPKRHSPINQPFNIFHSSSASRNFNSYSSSLWTIMFATILSYSSTSSMWRIAKILSIHTCSLVFYFY